MKQKHIKIKTTLYDYLIIALGMTLYVLSWSLFLIPAEITGGGITGLSVLGYYSMRIPISITYMVLNSVLVVAAIKVLGASFGIKTIFCMVLATILFGFTPGLVEKPFVDDTFLSTILGGIMGGIGIGVIFTRGGSAGGTDIIAMIVNKYRNISPGRVIMYCDVLIIASGYIVFQSPEKLVYGYVLMWVTTYTVDAFLSGNKASAQVFIFSRKYSDIADYINSNVIRGVTVIDGTGWYTKENIKIVMTIIRKREISMIFRKVKEIDPEAFISMGSVMGVYGKGFDNIKI